MTTSAAISLSSSPWASPRLVNFRVYTGNEQLVTSYLKKPDNEHDVIMALSHSGWDTEAALEELIKEAEENDW
ncbi:hypothetical protein B9Z55_025375 [Caenorhabditis nigoni]|nr:hypothetical protein B9Z55_025375 [Caenorhabditis nigoni]